MLRIEGLASLRARLAALKADEVMAHALAAQAERLAATVKAGLGDSPGSGEHDRPWQRSGALRSSVGVVADGLEAVVGSSDPAAAPQEMGTVHVPARPFLAPAAAEIGETLATAVGLAVRDAIGGSGEDGSA